ncbi:MAG: hypothetical protein ACT4OV_01370 [Microthrixaceae bacterium]
MRRTRTFWTASVTATAIAALLGSAAALEPPARPAGVETGERDAPVAAASASGAIGPTATETTAPSEPASGATAPAQRDDDRVDERPEHARLRLECKGTTEARGPGVLCRWSPSASPRFAAYRLLRGDGEERQVVFRTSEINHTWFFDRAVERGVEYHYLVQVLDAGGRVIGASNPASASLPDRPLERLDLACERVGAHERSGVACRWSATGRDDASGYTLVRSIDGGPREPILRTGVEGPNRYVDAPLRAGHRYTYVVLVIDRQGQVIGEGGPVTVGWPPDPAPADSPTR